MAGRDGTRNLTPVRTKEEAKERGRQGGIASGKARRAKRTMRERAQLLLDCKFTDEAMLEVFKAYGLKTKGLTMADAMIIGQMLGAITGKGGDSRNFKAIIDLVEPGGEQEDAESEHNQRMETISDLLKNPQPNREIKEFEDDG